MALWSLIGAVAVGGPRLLLHLVGSPHRADVLAQWENLTPSRVTAALGAMAELPAFLTLVVVGLLLPSWFYLALAAYRSRPGAGSSVKRG